MLTTPPIQIPIINSPITSRKNKVKGTGFILPSYTVRKPVKIFGRKDFRHWTTREQNCDLGEKKNKSPYSCTSLLSGGWTLLERGSQTEPSSLTDLRRLILVFEEANVAVI